MNKLVKDSLYCIFQFIFIMIVLYLSFLMLDLTTKLDKINIKLNTIENIELDEVNNKLIDKNKYIQQGLKNYVDTDGVK